MKNVLNISTDGTPELLSRTDTGDNAVIINGIELPSSYWVGTGTYTFVVGGVTFEIDRIAEDSGNIIMEAVTTTTYQLRKIESGGSGVTDNYEELENLPQIEGVTLIGNKTYEELNLQGITNFEIEAIIV